MLWCLALGSACCAVAQQGGGGGGGKLAWCSSHRTSIQLSACITCAFTGSQSLHKCSPTPPLTVRITLACASLLPHPLSMSIFRRTCDACGRVAAIWIGDWFKNNSVRHHAAENDCFGLYVCLRACLQVVLHPTCEIVTCRSSRQAVRRAFHEVCEGRPILFVGAAARMRRVTRIVPRLVTSARCTLFGQRAPRNDCKRFAYARIAVVLPI